MKNKSLRSIPDDLNELTYVVCIIIVSTYSTIELLYVLQKCCTYQVKNYCTYKVKLTYRTKKVETAWEHSNDNLSVVVHLFISIRASH